MDRFVTVVKPARKEREKHIPARFTPYPPPNRTRKPHGNYSEAVAQDKARLRQCVSFKLFVSVVLPCITRLLAPLKKDGISKPSAEAITKHLLNTLGDESNPITHSNIYERSGGVFLCDATPPYLMLDRSCYLRCIGPPALRNARR